jgi:hypothetical protein
MKTKTGWMQAGATALVMLALSALQGCAGVPGRPDDVNTTDTFCRIGLKTCVNGVMEPIVSEARPFRRVAIASTRTQGADAVAQQFEAELTKVRINDEPYYTIVQPSDPAREVTYEVSTTAWTIADSHTTQSRSRCNDQKSNKLFSSCKSTTQYTASCTVRKATVGATIRLRRKDGSVLATRQESGEGTSEYCVGDEGVTLKDPAALFGEAVGHVTDAFHRAVAVRVEKIALRYMTDTSGIQSAERQQRFNDALVFLKAGRVDRACPVFQELSEVERNSVAVFYNAGFCMQVKGDWCRANGLYKQADALTRSPDSDLDAAMKETRLSCTAKK